MDCNHTHIEVITEKAFYIDKGEKYFIVPDKTYVQCSACKEQLNISVITQRVIEQEVSKHIYG